MDIKSINNSFVNCFIPNCLFYNTSAEYNMSIDISKIQYNNYYQSYEFFESKFPKGYDNIIGFSDIIEDMSKNVKLKNLDPLDEINYLSIINGINLIKSE
jgi:hypothetical protein